MKFPPFPVAVLGALLLFGSGAAFALPVVSIRATDAFAIEKSTSTAASDPASFVISRSGNKTGALTVNLAGTIHGAEAARLWESSAEPAIFGGL